MNWDQAPPPNEIKDTNDIPTTDDNKNQSNDKDTKLSRCDDSYNDVKHIIYIYYTDSNDELPDVNTDYNHHIQQQQCPQ